MASAMIWATRRQLSGVVKYCCPINCPPANTSQRRNSALSRPSGCRVSRPVTRAWALMARQSANRGVSRLTIFSMNAAGSIGANRPERLRSLVITCVTLRPASLSPGVPPRKSGSAMGTGWILPSPTSILTMAGAKRVLAISAAATPAAPESKRRRVSGRVDGGKSKLFIGIIQKVVRPDDQKVQSSVAEHFIKAEVDFDFSPEIVLCWRQHRIGLATQGGPHRAVDHRLREGITGRGLRLRRRGERAILIKANDQQDPALVGIGGACRRVPALVKSGAQRVELALREARGFAGPGPQRQLPVEGLAYGGEALRLALVQQRRNFAGIKFRLRLGVRLFRRGLFDLRLLGFRLLDFRGLGLVLLGFFLFGFVLLDRLGDRIGLGLRRFLLGGLRLGLGLRGLLAAGLGIRRLCLRGRRRIAGSGDELGLLHDLGQGILDRLLLCDFFHQRLGRLRFRGVARARPQFRELLGGNDVDRHRFDRRGIERLGRERDESPQQHASMPDDRYGKPGFHADRAVTPFHPPSPGPRDETLPPIAVP